MAGAGLPPACMVTRSPRLASAWRGRSAGECLRGKRLPYQRRDELTGESTDPSPPGGDQLHAQARMRVSFTLPRGIFIYSLSESI
jgi:hypothetical protein